MKDAHDEAVKSLINLIQNCSTSCFGGIEFHPIGCPIIKYEIIDCGKHEHEK